MKRVVVVLIGALLLALALAGSTLVFLAATDGGTRFLADQAERFLPVRFEAVSGALLREIEVGRVSIDLEDRQVRIDQLAAAIGLWPLVFENRLVISRLSAAEVVVGASTAPPDPGPAPPLELPYLPLSVIVRQAVVERLDVAGAFPMRIEGAAALTGEGLTLRRLALDADVLTLSGSGKLGSGANPQLSANVNWALPGQEWSGAGRVSGRVDALTIAHTLSGPVAGEAGGTVNLAALDDPHVDVDVHLHDLVFGDTAIRGLTGHVSGTTAQLVADARALIEAPGIAPFDVQASAYGPTTGPLTLRNVSANALDGTQEAQGSVSWQQAVVVHLGGFIQNVSLDGWLEQLTGRVNGAVQFSYQDENISLVVDQLTGNLNQRPVTGRLEVVQSGQTWNVSPFDLGVDDNRVAGSLQIVDERMDLRAELKAPALGALGFGVSGDADGRLRLQGRWPELSGMLALSGAALDAYGVQADTYSVSARLKGGNVDATASAARLRREQLELETVQLDADGNAEDFGWRGSWMGGAASGRVQRQGDAITVRLDDARQELIAETWRLEEAAEVRLEGGAVEASPACIAGGDAAVCVHRLVWRDGVVDTAGVLRRAPVAMLRPWLPIGLEDSAFLEGGWNLAGGLDDLTGDVNLAARGLAVRPGTEDDAIALPDVQASGRVGDGLLTVNLAAAADEFDLTGEGRLTPLSLDGALSGRITSQVADIEPLKVFDQRLEELAGALSGEIVIGGTLRAPRLDGQLRLNGGVVKVTDPGVSLDQVDLLLDIDQTGRFDLSGTVRQDDDQVAVSASGTGLFDQTLALHAALSGEGIELQHPDWEVTLSPDLSFDYREGGGMLGGRVTVPRAEVRINTLPANTPSVSKDVVVVGREETTGGAANPVRVNVELVLGDDVVLKALGITAELKGSLRARVGAQGRANLRGTVDITGGVLSTQGQILEIESGSVAYNGPIDRPYIELRAVRRIDDASPPVKVGLHIQGSADSLSSSVFSDPVMSDTRALSFLVLGRDIEDDTASSDSGKLMAAAINLGLSQSKGITGELMRLTGLDELSASAEAEDDFSIVAGKRVTDDLYVRYTYNTLSAVGAFLVRYDLSNRWQLEAASGEKSSMDLMYHIQK